MSDNIMPPEELDRITRRHAQGRGHQKSHATGPKEVTFSTSLTHLSRLAPEAFHGWLGQWVNSLETEADPVALLGLGLGALGHCVRETVRVPGGYPVNHLMVLVGDERAGSRAAWDYVDQLFSRVSPRWKKKPFEGRALPMKAWPSWAEAWNQGWGSFLVRSRPEEVVARLTKPEAIWSGFAPRTLLLGVRGGSPRPLRDPVPVSVLLDAVNELNPSLEFAKWLIGTELGLTPEAVKLWEVMYSSLREPRYAGTMIDIMTELAERHVLRLAGLYAVVDQSPEIKPEHLLAALAIWDHHEETLRELFGQQTGNKKQDTILRALRERHPAGLTTGEINSKVLYGNSRGGAEPLLKELEHAGLIYSQEEPANGRGKRPAHRWFLTQTPDIGVKHSYLGIARAIRGKTG